MKRVLYLIIFTLCILSLSGCASKEASNFDKQVEAVMTLPEITDNDIAFLENAYNALSPSDKTQIKRYEEYQQVLIEYENSNYSEKIRSAISSEDVFQMIETRDIIMALDDSQRSKISGLQELEEALSSSAYETILSYNNTEVEKMYELIVYCKNLFSDEQLETCLIHYGKWNGYYKAVDYIKALLKSPKSYTFYSGTAGGFKNPLKSGAYRGRYEIKFGATNSFGAEVTNTEEVYVTFFVDKDNLTIDYAYVGDGGPYGLDGVSATPTPRN